MKQINILISLIFVLLFKQINAQSFFKTHKEINPFNYKVVKNKIFNKGAVSCAHPLASMVGAAILKEGGNAFDAAIAVQLALAVVYPAAGNIGGGGFLLARKADGTLIGLDYREAAPLKAHKNMYLDEKGNPITNLSMTGSLAAGIPGTIAGLFETHKYAVLPFSKLIEPAIELALYGFVITQREATNLNRLNHQFIKNSTNQNIAFCIKNHWNEGDTLIQKDLANTLIRIKEQGKKGFYEGKTADLIVAEMKRGKGIIDYADLKNYKAIYRTPIEFNYNGYHLISFAPPSSGGILLAQMLKMIEPYKIKNYGFQTPKSVQLMIEVERRAFADRAEHLGDPDFWKVPTKQLINEKYLKSRMKDYDSTKANNSNNIKAGNIHESEETTHLSIIDEQGNVISVTTTLNDSYGCKTVVGEAGFILNNEMDDFSVKPGTPNMYGAIGGEANSIQPNKRMLSSMTPTIVLKNNKPFLTVGTPGGTTIPTSIFQTIVNLIDFNLSLEESINNPKFHHQWKPDEVLIEKNFKIETLSKLSSMGYSIKNRAAIGRTEAIKVLSNNQKEAVADNRGDDSVAGY